VQWTFAFSHPPPGAGLARRNRGEDPQLPL